MRKAVQIGIKIEKEFPNLVLSQKNIDRIEQYLTILEQWNKKTNLTAVRNANSMIVKLVLDSLVVLQPSFNSDIRNFLNGTVLDMGSGAGIPGVILAICNPLLEVVSVDKSQKKIVFQDFVKSRLGLENFHPISNRLENLAVETENTVRYDCIVSRAFDQIKGLIKFGNTFLRDSGHLILWKGENWRKEMDDIPVGLKRQFPIQKTVRYQFADDNHGGTILVFKKEENLV